jgi:deazaflavin-dependent oxidoreductase (nitroreductase family)
VQNAVTNLHCLALRASGWRLAGRIHGLEVLLLTTRGRRSGKQRTVPLMYLEDDGGYVVIGSNGGAPGDPGWVRNLAADPAATIRLRHGRRAVRGAPVGDAERARLWQRITATAPNYDVYARRTAREIPLIRLRPV